MDDFSDLFRDDPELMELLAKRGRINRDYPEPVQNFENSNTDFGTQSQIPGNQPTPFVVPPSHPVPTTVPDPVANQQMTPSGTEPAGADDILRSLGIIPVSAFLNPDPDLPSETYRTPSPTIPPPTVSIPAEPPLPTVSAASWDDTPIESTAYTGDNNGEMIFSTGETGADQGVKPAAEKAVKKGKKKKLPRSTPDRIASILFYCILVLAFFWAITWGVQLDTQSGFTSYLNSFTYFSVTSDTYDTGIEPGTLVIATIVQPEDIKTGDQIVFAGERHGEKDLLTIGQVFSIEPSPDNPDERVFKIYTSELSDDLNVDIPSNVVYGKVSGSFPGLGNFFLQAKAKLIAIIVVIVILIAACLILFLLPPDKRAGKKRTTPKTRKKPISDGK